MTRARVYLTAVLLLLTLLGLDGGRADGWTVLQREGYVLAANHNRSKLQRSNLLVNPGFELETEGWSAWPSGATFGIVTNPVHGGDYAAALTKTEARGHAYIFQSVAVTPGARYAAEVWALLDDPWLTNVKLRVHWLDANGDEIAAAPPAVSEQRRADWQLLRLDDILAPPAASWAQVQGYAYINTASPAQPALFDDFRFLPADAETATPSPSPTASATPGAPSATPVPTATTTPTAPPVAAGGVVVNEVVYDPATPGGDPGDEWVELYNTTAFPVDLGGWRLADNVSGDTLPAFELPAGGFVVVAASDGFRALYPTYAGLLISLDSPIGNGLANTGDSVTLWHMDGRVIDGVSYGDNSDVMFPPVPLAEPGSSLERVPAGADTDTAADWYPRSHPTPGQGVRIWRRYMPLLAAATERGFPLSPRLLGERGKRTSSPRLLAFWGEGG